jgi:hypothetical protein
VAEQILALVKGWLGDPLLGDDRFVVDEDSDQVRRE